MSQLLEQRERRKVRVTYGVEHMANETGTGIGRGGTAAAARDAAMRHKELEAEQNALWLKKLRLVSRSELEDFRARDAADHRELVNRIDRLAARIDALENTVREMSGCRSSH